MMVSHPWPSCLVGVTNCREMMGLANAKFQLRNPRVPELEAVEIEALAGTGAVHMCIPEQRIGKIER